MFAEHTVETPAWLLALVEDILESVTPLNFIGPLGYRYWEPPEDSQNPSEPWQLIVYPTSSEIRGSDKNDGALFISGFQLDVARIIGFMCSVDEVVWRSPARYSGNLDGPEIIVCGRYASKHVKIRFFHSPPPDEPPSYAVDPQTGRAMALPA